MLDRHIDEPLEALLGLLDSALNGEIAVDEDQACASTHGWPISLARLPAAKLPALAVWRQRATFAPRMTGAHDERVTLRLAYLLPPTPLDRVGARWPLLQRAWEVVTCTLLAGHYVSHRDDAPVLEAAGFVDVDLTGATVDFLTPRVDEEIVPQWEATIVVTLRTAPETSTLDDLSLGTELHPADLPEDERPLVSEIHE